MILSRENLLGSLPPFRDEWILINSKQNVKDIINEVLDSHKEFAPLYDRIALYFDGNSIEDICKNIYDFLKKNIKYKEEKEEDQTTATPAGILSRGFGDCKHYSTFSGGVLDALQRVTGKKINWCYRFASYDPFNKSPHHVFVVVHDKGDEIWIDPTPGSDNNQPMWQVDKKIHTMALRRNIAGFNNMGVVQQLSLTPETADTSNMIEVAPDQLPLSQNELPSAEYVTALEEQQADEEVTPELQNAIEVLMNYGIMNDQGEISDTVLNNLTPTLSPNEFQTIADARHVILAELQNAVTVGSFFSKLWAGVKKVSLALPRNAYLSLVALNAFGYATKLHNAIYNTDGTYWQPGQQQLYDKWTKLGGTWTNLRNAINSGAKKKALLGSTDFKDFDSIDPECLDDYFMSRINGFPDGRAIGVAPAAAAAAWYTVAAAIIVAITPLILGILKQRASQNQLPASVNPQTGLPYGVNPGTTPPSGSTGFMDQIKQWIQANPLPAAGIAAGAVYLITNKGKIGAVKQRSKKSNTLLLVGAVGIGGYLLLKHSAAVITPPPTSDVPIDTTTTIPDVPKAAPILNLSADPGFQVHPYNFHMTYLDFDPVPNAATYDVQYRRLGANDWDPPQHWGGLVIPIRQIIANGIIGETYQWRVRVNYNDGNSSDYVQGNDFVY